MNTDTGGYVILHAEGSSEEIETIKEENRRNFFATMADLIDAGVGFEFEYDEGRFTIRIDQRDVEDFLLHRWMRVVPNTEVS